MTRIAITSIIALLLSGATATAQNIHYDYDSLGRLCRAVFPAGDIINYKMDANGNRTDVITTTGGSGETSSTDCPQATSAPGTVIPAQADSSANGNNNGGGGGGSNTAPVANDDTYSANPGQSLTLTVLVNDTDADNDPLIVTATDAGTINAAQTQIFYTAPSSPGQYTHTYTISDQNGGSDTATITVIVFFPF